MKRIFFLFVFLYCLKCVNAQKPELIVPTGHSDYIFSLALSADGKYIVTGSAPAVKLFETVSGKEIQTFSYHNGVVRAVAISSNGKYIATGGSDGKLIIWETSTKKLLYSFSRDTLLGLAFSPDNAFLFSTGADHLVVKTNVSTGQSVAHYPVADKKKKQKKNDPIPEHISNTSLAISKDGKFLAVGSGKGLISVLNAENMELIKTVNPCPEKKISSLAFSPDGTRLASCCSNSGCLIDISSGTVISTLKGHTDVVSSVYFSPDGKYLITGSRDGKVKFWDPTSGSEIRIILDVGYKIYAIQYSPDSRFVYTVGTSTQISQYDLNTKKETGIFAPYGDAINSLVITDNNMLVAGSWDKRIKMFDLSGNKGVVSWIAHDKEIYDAKISPNGQYLVSGSFDKMVKIWNLSTRQLIRQYGPYKQRVGSFFFVNNKQVMGAIGEAKVAFWSIDEQKALTKSIEKNNYPSVSACCLSNDKNFWLLGMGDGFTWMWDENNKSLPPQFDDRFGGYINAVAISPTETHFALATSKQGLQLHKLDRKWVRSAEVVFSGRGDVDAVAFSPDGSMLAGESENNVICIWNVNTGEKLRELKGHNDKVLALTFSKDGKFLYTTGKDSRIIIWDTQFGTYLGTLFLLGENDWVVVTPNGYFDASPNGMKQLYYVQGIDVLPLESFYERFYTPNLFARIASGEDFYSNPTLFAGQLKMPPEVTILNPKAGALVDKQEVTVTVEAKDMGGGIDEIRLFLNGKLVPEDQRGFKRVDQGNTVQKEYSILLMGGTNEIKAIALNTDRTESLPYTIKVDAKAAEAASDLYIISVGIDEYKNAQYRLNYGKTDATSFSSILEQKASGIFKMVKKIDILDTKASKEEIINAFNQVISNAQPQDVFVFFYAGHGVMSEQDEAGPSDFHLALFDVTQLYGRKDMLAEKGISAKELKDLCSKIKAQKQVIFLDACQSGGAVETFAMRGAAEEKAILQLGRSTGVVVFASTGSDQFASEFKDLQHGVFTYALIKGLEGGADGGTKDSKITVKEIDAFLNDMVPELTQKYRGTAQYPKVWSRGMDFPIVIVK